MEVDSEGRRRNWLLLVGFLLVGAVIGALAAALPWPFAATRLIALQIGIVVVPAGMCAAGLMRVRHSVRAGRGWQGLGGVVVGGITLVAVSWSGFQLLVGARTSKLSSIGFGPIQVNNEVTGAYIVFLVALLAFAAGQAAAHRLFGSFPAHPENVPERRRGRWFVETRTCYIILLVIGVAGHLLLTGSAAANIDNRGLIRGVGVPVLMQYGIWIAVAMGILNRHWGSRWLVGVSTVAAVYAELSSVTRTPLVMLGVAMLLRLLAGAAASRHPWRHGLTGVGLLYVGAILVVGLSGWRADLTRGGDPSLVNHLIAVGVNPFANLSGGGSSTQATGGLDTVDGLILAGHVDPAAVGARLVDPLKAVTELVPYQIWPTKPEWLSNTITHRYTIVSQGAGIFLSGPGYAEVVFKGIGGMAAVFVLLGFGSAWLFTRARSRMPSLGMWLLAYFLISFLVEGDAFNGFQAIALSGLLLIGSAVARGVHALAVSGRHARVHPAAVGGSAA